jgi:hypothetical protein
MSDDGYQVVGPFSSGAALVTWGQRWQAQNDDDPRWQSIYLSDPAAAPKHIVP